jgi:uncharacterized membrane protein
VTFTSTHLKLVLAVSLALNFALGGLWAGRWLERRRHPAPMAMTHHGARGPWGNVLGQRGFAGQGRILHAARVPVRAALEKEPFDPAALERALADLREKTSAGQAKVHAALVEVAKQSTAEERRELARSFETPSLPSSSVCRQGRSCSCSSARSFCSPGSCSSAGFP